VVYISSRRRQRAKAFRLRWMRVLDEHWIAYPRFIAGELTVVENLKLRLLDRPRVRFIDTVLPAAAAAETVLPQLRDFVLVVPGGGTAHPGAPEAPRIIAAAAEGVAAKGVTTLLVGVGQPGATHQLIRLPLLPPAQLVDLLRRARTVVTNGGDTLLQALACACACVAVPIAHDQAARIARCRALGLIHATALQSEAIIGAVTSLHGNDEERAALIARGRAAGITDGMPGILDWIGALAGQARV
jgi:UDP:flavonoid glycosyltransferase YjiC (YdhE family)